MLKFLTFLLCLEISCVSAAPTPQSSYTKKVQLEKGRFLIDQDQIVLTDEGIFIDMEGHLLSVKEVRFEENGKYSCDFRDYIVYCGNGHPYWVYQSGCNVFGCQFYGG